MNQIAKGVVQIGFPNDFLSGFDTVVISDIAKDKIPADCKAIILLCELNQNEKGEAIKRQDFYGIEVAKKLRREGVNTPIIFTSFLSRARVYNKDPQKVILKFVGHHFIQLPASPQAFLDKAKKVKKLSPLELKDIQFFACNPDGIVNERIHQIISLPQKLGANGPDFVKKELTACIKEIHIAFQERYDGFLKDFEKHFAEINKENIEEAISTIRKRGNDLINDYKRKKGEAVTQGESKPWKLLLLDDELDEKSEIVKALELNGVNVICCNNAKAALNALKEDDKLRGKISIILTDYRLYTTDTDGMQMQQEMQGYSFLQEVGDKFYSRVLSAIVYSGMPRQFLLDALNNFKIRTEKYSKDDLKTTDTGAINYLVSRIIEVGDKNYNALLSLPLGNKGWSDHLHSYYLQYRNLPDYEIKEREVSDYCKQWVEDFRNGKPRETPMIKGDAFNAKKNEKEADTINRFLAFYKTRRLAQYLYIYFDTNHKTDPRGEVAAALIRSGKGTKESDVKRFFSQILGLSLTEFPFGATIEELCWFEYDMGIKVLDSYNRYREKFREFENLIGEFIFGDKSLKGFLGENGYKINEKDLKESDGRELASDPKDETEKTGKKKRENLRELSFNPKTYNPYLFDKMDVGFCIDWLTKQIKNMNKQGIEEGMELIHQLSEKLKKS